MVNGAAPHLQPTYNLSSPIRCALQQVWWIHLFPYCNNADKSNFGSSPTAFKDGALHFQLLPPFLFLFPLSPPTFSCKMSPIYFSLGAHFEFYHQYMRNAFFKLLPLNCTDISHSGDTILFTHPALWNKHGCQNSAWVVKETFTLCFMRFPRFVAASMVVKTAVNQKSTTKLQ